VCSLLRAQLEDPFIHPPNDLPAEELQREFHARCLAAWDGCAAAADAELVPHAGLSRLILERGAAQRRCNVSTVATPSANSDAASGRRDDADASGARRSARPLKRDSTRPNRFWGLFLDKDTADLTERSSGSDRPLSGGRWERPATRDLM
jgi:hypothetical protein